MEYQDRDRLSQTRTIPRSPDGDQNIPLEDIGSFSNTDNNCHQLSLPRLTLSVANMYPINPFTQICPYSYLTPVCLDS